MAEIPKRDTSGKCEGECRDRVMELKEKQQKDINKEGVDYSTAETTSVPHARSRNNPPGELGGHV